MFKEELKLVPHKPGSYQMIDKNGTIIYVGKAKDLSNRLHSYFRGTLTGKTAIMVSEVDHFQYIVTKSETESFILEINLIKKYNPKYNILLKDDKTYPYIEYIDKPYPLLKVVRYTGVNKKKHPYLFGPYPNAYAAKRIVNLINRLYPLKKCNNLEKKVCLYYHIGECLGYCQKEIDTNKSESMKNDILSFLHGNDKIIIDKVNEKIEKLSSELNFEKALELKNELDYIKVLFDDQKVEIHDTINRDIISSYVLNGYLSVAIFFIRNGKLLGCHTNIITLIDEEDEELTRYIYNFYQNHEIPKEILTDKENEDLSLALNVPILKPIRGDKASLLKMCHENAKINLEKSINSFINSEKRSVIANDTLKEILGLNTLHTIEAFDNSNLFGTYSVSAMVVFKNGLPSKNDYRKFKISFDKNDDYNMMKEVIYRRYYRLLMEDSLMPDLIIVDGGENQINATKEVINSLNLNIKICGLKKDEHHNTRCLIDENLKEYDLTNYEDVFNYLTRIQDEVHRFVITYHKQIRSKGSLSSILDSVDGIGDKRKKQLLKKYGSITKMKEAPIEELSTIIPLKTAINLHDYLVNLK